MEKSCKDKEGNRDDEINNCSSCGFGVVACTCSESLILKKADDRDYRESFGLRSYYLRRAEEFIEKRHEIMGIF